jgi:hypothetical protein
METIELIQKLLQHYDDYIQGEYQQFSQLCRDCRAAADKLDWYVNRCRELEEELEKTKKERDTVIKNHSRIENICGYCRNFYSCEGPKCSDYIEGVGDADGKFPNWKWSCMDFAWGQCSKLENTPCNGCIDNKHRGFDWGGLKNADS